MNHNQTTHPTTAVFDENSIASRLTRAKSVTLGPESHTTAIPTRKRAALGDLSNMPTESKSLKPTKPLINITTSGMSNITADHKLTNNVVTRLPAPVSTLPRKMPSKEPTTIQTNTSSIITSNEVVDDDVRLKRRATNSIVNKPVSSVLQSSSRSSSQGPTSSSRASTGESLHTSVPPSARHISSSSSSSLSALTISNTTTSSTITSQKRNFDDQDSLEIQEIGSAEFASSSSSTAEVNNNSNDNNNTAPINTKSDDETLVQVVERPITKSAIIATDLSTSQHNNNNTSDDRSVAPVVKRPRINIDWEDLDQEEFDDPLMVSEYAVEIFDHLYALEAKYMPNANYMDDQSDLDWNMRGVLVDWLVEVHTKFRLLPETLFLAVNIVDRFMSVRVITLEKVQLVGIASMIIAAKIEEVFAPSVQNYVYIADNGYEQKEVLKAEKCILEVLNFDFSYPNPMNFLRRISKADNYEVQTRTIAKYLLEIALVDHRLMRFKTSKVAAASMYMARMMLKRGDWNNNLIHYSGDYTESDLTDVVRALLTYLTEPVTHEAFFKKYASKRFMKASIISRKWAHESVGAGTAENW